MLGLFGSKSDHPMADVKSALALLENLPKNDALKTLHELTSWIESVGEQANFRLDHQFAVLRLLDETARPFERKLTRDYYASTVLSAFQENRLWMGLNEFHLHILSVYSTVLARYRNGDKGASSIKSMLPLLACRGINAATNRLKSAAAHYALVDQVIWKSLAEFYLHAETEKYIDDSVALYAGSSAKSSVREEFAVALMWYASSFGSLNRLNTHFAERLIAYLHKNITVSAQPGTESRFVFDLQHPMSPMRLVAEATSQPGLRFLGVDKFQAQVEVLLKTLEKNFVPEELNLGGIYDAATVRAVALHLGERLASPPPTRRNTRHNVKVNLSVSNGFSGLLEQIYGSLNFGSDASSIWQVEDLSASGLRCVLPASKTDGVKIGALVGIKPEKQDGWGVGSVRRISRDLQNNLHVGIEMLAKQVAGAELDGIGSTEGQQVLWLNNPGGNSSEVDLLMSPDTFTGKRSLHVRLADKNYLLIPLGLVEKGEDYELGRYRKIEEDASSEIQ